MTKDQALQKEFHDAVVSMEAVLKQEKNEFIRDSAIKRFELCFDLSWKAIKAFAEEKGTSCTSPMGCFREAYHQGIIAYEKVWIDMVKTRNKTVHTYSEALAEEVYGKLPEALAAFQKLEEALVAAMNTNKVGE